MLGKNSVAKREKVDTMEAHALDKDSFKTFLC